MFENRGEAMGASNPHPHGQVWAGTALPTAIATRGRHPARLPRRGRAARCSLDVAAQEADGPRVVEANEHWLAIVPFWAVWPFEVLVLPALAGRPAAGPRRRRGATPWPRSWAGRSAATTRLFGVPFPYSMGWHGAPFDADAATDAWVLHAHAYPPLLRSATVRKFMVGYELLAEAQRDVTPEDAAARLRALEID